MKLLIVGAGISGCTLAHHALKKGVQVHLLHNGTNVSSTVAAGIMNPLVFRRTTMTWKGEETFSYAQHFYDSLEPVLGCSIFIRVPIRRLFAHEQERETWIKRQGEEKFNNFIVSYDEHNPNYVAAPDFGSGIVNHTGYIDSKAYMHANWDYFKQLGILEEHTFDHAQFDAQQRSYRGEVFDAICFCEGKDSVYNPLFSWVPIQQTKGEVLQIQLKHLPTNESLNRKCFLMPMRDGSFKVGSTYVWNTDDATPTEEGKATILEHLSSITDEQPEVLFHEAGVRPTVLDRRPVLGVHPDFAGVFIANGMGTKGYSLAPSMLKQLCDYMVDGKELEEEVNVSRFYGMREK